ncbi:PqqD family protein [Elongatibacter sediminis]|uniref:PqqD family protein n=1 Tax=Elongatibacter sediminis TaxID=3119006 RepID=A0AAW9RFT5_9GAMM
MIITVFVSTHSAGDQWRAELLEQAWLESGQPGELLRLVAAPANAALPMHGTARVVRTLPYDPHPYLPDRFSGYKLPAALLEWLVRESVDASLLLLDLESVLLQPLDDEAEPGGAVGHRWSDWPEGEGPFGLAEDFTGLQAWCVNRTLEPPRVTFPVMIHSTDLRKMAARWLELTGLIRNLISPDSELANQAHQVAYAVAAAEYRIPHRAKKLAAASTDRRAGAPVLDYGQPIVSARKETVWDAATYRPWTRPDATAARAGAGRDFLSFLEDYVTRRESGALLATRRPRRCHGVREARLPDRMVLEVPGAEELLQLNASAGAIWNLCDNQRTLADIADVLQEQFEVPGDVVCDDVERTVIELHSQGALELDKASP